MIRAFATLFLFVLFPQVSSAQLEGVLKFNGQNADQLQLEKMVTVKRPVTYQVPSTCTRDVQKQVPGTCTRQIPKEVPGTCTRQVPSQEYRCHTVTRYRQECTWIPASQNCWTENDRQCRSETRYRKECTEGPSRRVCHRLPDRQECSTGPSQTVCTDRPSREVCSERTGQRVCSTIPGGRDCKTVPGERTCRTVSGGEDCRTERGEPICRQVPYQENICHDVPRQRCETIPGRNDCRNIPYNEQECGMETVYRTEEYACMRTIYVPEEYSCMKTITVKEEYACVKPEVRMEPFQKLLKGDLALQFQSAGLTDEFQLKVAVNAKDADLKEFDLSASLVAEPKQVVILKSKELKVLEETDTEIRLEGVINLELQEKNVQKVTFPSRVDDAYVSKREEHLDIVFAGKLLDEGEVEIKLTRKDVVLAEVKDQFPSARVKRARIDRQEGLRISLKGILREQLRSGLKLEFKLLAPSQKFEGEVLNKQMPVSEKAYKKMSIDLI